MYAQTAKMPFLPLLEKLAEKPVLYGVLSLLKRICGRETQSTCSFTSRHAREARRFVPICRRGGGAAETRTSR